MAKKKSNSMRERMGRTLEERKDAGGGGTIQLPDGIDFFKPEKGTTEMAIFPFEVSDGRNPDKIPVGEDWYRRIYYAHFSIGVDEKSYVCLKSIGKACPICQEYARLGKDKNVDEDTVKALKPKERELYNIIVDGEHMVFEMSAFLFGRTLDDELREGEEEYRDFPLIDGGYDLRVRFKNKKLGKNSFLETSRIDFDQRDEPLEGADDPVDLDACLNLKTYEQLEAAMFGTESAEEPEKEEKEEKTSTRSTKREKTPEKEKPAGEYDDIEHADLVEEVVDRELLKKVKARKLDEDELRDLLTEDDAEKAAAAEEPDPDPAPTGDDYDELDKAELVAEVVERELLKKLKAKKADEDELRELLREDDAEGGSDDKPDPKEAKGGKGKSNDDNPCPHGHTYGVDCDEHPKDCDPCKEWDACADKKDELDGK